MGIDLNPGKWQRLRSLTDEEDRFMMMAIDQRGSLGRSIGKAMGKADATDEDMVKFKQSVTKVLAPYATAVLTDPIYGYPQSIAYLPAGVGLLLAAEKTGYDKSEFQEKGRLTRLIDNWNVEKAQKAGADAVKLLLYYQPDASKEVNAHQQTVAKQVGEECERFGMPYLLELVAYPLGSDNTDSAEFARQKPDLVARSAAEFSKPQYKVDILKLEFPADLKWTKEFANGAFDGKRREAVYSLADVKGFCEKLDKASGTPWVILSAGVDIAEFLVQVELATGAGASGFLCGRAIWKDCVNFYPDIDKMEDWLYTEGAYNFIRCNAYAQKALPWTAHRRFA